MKSRDGQTADNKDSWLNNWPVRGRTSYPLLFDRSGQAKQAFEAVVQVAADNGKK
jgi:endo-1,4-beta-xylanase